VPRRWQVAQRFKSGLLLKTTEHDEALFIGTTETSAGPFNIQIPLPQFQQLQNCGNNAVCDGSGTLFMGSFCLMTANVPSYSTVAPDLDPEQQQFLLTHLSSYLDDPRGQVPRVISDDPRDLSPRVVRGLVQSLLGRGPGLTPSGDDFLVGMMAVIPHRSLADEVIQQAQREGATGVVSQAFFHAAAKRHFNEDICLMLHAAIKYDPALLFRLFERIKSFGHSSGLDLLAGVQFGLHCLLSQRPVCHRDIRLCGNSSLSSCASRSDVAGPTSPAQNPWVLQHLATPNAQDNTDAATRIYT